MSDNNTNSVVPYNVSGKATPSGSDDTPLEIVNRPLQIHNREEVRQYLPDILGRVLARVWIDKEFHDQFSNSPQDTLEEHGVFLPDNMSIEFQRGNTDRPRIVVYERPFGSRFKLRIFYLQLVMMAGR
ncbi:MAG: hypothetical protein ISQ27_03750 [PS1 clade bacterium]|nr:hypothetical protein [PS1 clade bacterium]